MKFGEKKFSMLAFPFNCKVDFIHLTQSSYLIVWGKGTFIPLQLGGPSSDTLTFFPYLWFTGGSQLKKKHPVWSENWVNLFWSVADIKLDPQLFLTYLQPIHLKLHNNNGEFLKWEHHLFQMHGWSAVFFLQTLHQVVGASSGGVQWPKFTMEKPDPVLGDLQY